MKELQTKLIRLVNKKSYNYGNDLTYKLNASFSISSYRDGKYLGCAKVNSKNYWLSLELFVNKQTDSFTSSEFRYIADIIRPFAQKDITELLNERYGI